MKKLLILICLSFLLVGCSSKGGSTTLSDADELIWSGPNVSYTKQDLYEAMKDCNDYSTVISNSVLVKMAEADGLDLTEEITELESVYDSYLEMLGEYTVTYFGDKDSYVSKMIADKIVEKYLTADIEENFDKYVKENNPYYGEVFYVSEKEMADQIKEAVESQTSTVEYAASSAGYTDSISPKVYTDKSDLPVEVKEVVLNNDAPYFGIVEVETYATDTNGNTTTSTRYYVVNITNKNVEEFKDEFITSLVGSEDTTSYIQKLINNHNVRFHDQSAYESFSSVYDGAK